MIGFQEYRQERTKRRRPSNNPATSPKDGIAHMYCYRGIVTRAILLVQRSTPKWVVLGFAMGNKVARPFTSNLAAKSK
ncbi:hypothetical protein KIN20_028449 [Parelaphostrongylus tenuis]|uniref:Uncharacterized protein n=1 Tax=Parelaphostrongylus tenuis TaxID=148309 RepID=A0AAD5R197_PARTN|nr:hypothetical protein KIN20_028449 [Parelaphostrongylus tenuis]